MNSVEYPMRHYYDPPYSANIVISSANAMDNMNSFRRQ